MGRHRRKSHRLHRCVQLIFVALQVCLVAFESGEAIVRFVSEL
jgi:hypothetical protein